MGARQKLPFGPKINYWLPSYGRENCENLHKNTLISFRNYLNKISWVDVVNIEVRKLVSMYSADEFNFV